MSAVLGPADIRQTKKYWFSQIPYQTVIANLPANSQQGIFAVRGWNPEVSLETLVSLSTLGVTQGGNIELDIVHDSVGSRRYAAPFPPELSPRYIGSNAVKNLSLVVRNNNPSALPNVQLNQLITAWQMPITFKVLQGYALTDAEKAIADATRVPQSPIDRKGTLPIPWEDIIRRTYWSQAIDEVLDIPLLPQATTIQQTFHQIQAGPNELLVVRNIASEGTLDYGVTISVDCDDIVGLAQLQAANMNLDAGTEMFLNAEQQVNFNIQAAVAPPGPTPTRLEVWRLSLSNILRVRLELLSMAGLQQLMANVKAGESLYQDIQAGVY